MKSDLMQYLSLKLRNANGFDEMRQVRALANSYYNLGQLSHEERDQFSEEYSDKWSREQVLVPLRNEINSLVWENRMAFGDKIVELERSSVIRYGEMIELDRLWSIKCVDLFRHTDLGDVFQKFSPSSFPAFQEQFPEQMSQFTVSKTNL